MDKFWQIDFSDEYLTNIDIIDNEHREIANLANKLYDMSANPNIDEKEITKQIEITKSTILKHFKSEIEFYKQYNLPDLELHINQHKKMEDYLNVLETKEFPLVVKALMTNQLVFHYLIKHLFLEDKKNIKMIQEIIKKESA
jgi:hemerythrin-like metal-binding protein